MLFIWSSHIKFRHLWLVTAFLIAGCTPIELEIEPREYPLIGALVCFKTGSSLIMKCNVLDAPGTITDHGFYWESKPSIYIPKKRYKASLGEGSLGEFSLSVDTLAVGRKYTVKAYAVSNGITTYGKVLELIF